MIDRHPVNNKTEKTDNILTSRDKHPRNHLNFRKHPHDSPQPPTTKAGATKTKPPHRCAKAQPGCI